MAKRKSYVPKNGEIVEIVALSRDGMPHTHKKGDVIVWDEDKCDVEPDGKVYLYPGVRPFDRELTVVERKRMGTFCYVEPVEKSDVPRNTAFSDQLDAELAAIREMLIVKNAAYGNSTLEPANVFSDLDPVAGIKVRIDDKIKRLKNLRAKGGDTEDTVGDLIGYLIQLRIAEKYK